ncbi:MAG: phosphatase PAP2 family protein [Dehalococcoidia bacterium]
MIRRARWRPFATAGIEALLVVAAYLVYSAIRVLVEGTEARAVDHAIQLISIEKTLGLFHEEAVQRFVQSQPWLAATMERIYLWAYLPLIVGAAAIVYVRDREMYRCYRNTFFASAAIGLIFFAMVPVAPPRMLPELGFIDPIHASMTTSGAKNEFAAVPSFHFGFTMLAAMGIAHAFAWPRVLTFALAFLPAIMLLAIVSTANHFFLDAAIGALVVMAAWMICVNGSKEEPAADPQPALRPA